MTVPTEPGIGDIDIDRFISDGVRLLYAPRAVRRRIEEHGFTLARADFYSSLPLLKDLDSTFEGGERERRPVYDRIFDRAHIAAQIREMGRFSAEFDPPATGNPTTCTEYFWENGAFSCTDAMAYYCLVRRHRPRRIVEIGSGFSTLVADAALRRNGSGEIVCIEPFPLPFIAGLQSVTRLIGQPIQTLSPEDFAELIGPADMLFIDSTHTVKIGSDCLYLYLVLLPSIAGPLLVHTHDVFLPFGMPLQWAGDLQIHWTEQYLLYAYLLDNPRARVVFGSNYAAHFLPEQTAGLMRGRSMVRGGSLWYAIHGVPAAS